MANFSRQLDILPPQTLVYPIHCIGLGGIGSNVAFYLRKMGFSQFFLWDDDRVEAHNIPSQHFYSSHVGDLKTQAMKSELEAALDADCRIDQYGRFSRSHNLYGIVIAGVDSMASREEIWRSVQKSQYLVPLYIDGRIGVEWDEERGRVTGEFIEIFTIVPGRMGDRELYEEHLFTDEEASPLRCTAQAVAYIGAFMAGFIGANVRKWLMRVAYHRYVLYDCLTNQILVATN
ncbi:MAG: sulfur carrier protein ThiS adenylyltransferase [Parcubacteria group bacterium Gr01-1014_66]|nr:MAG: sulfur carrier protein ThiS adenylyltransferase [Parcubacteria group bacterium Gr01-1014_66]